MTRHLLRLMWNRKRRNALLCVEIFFSFVAVAAIAVLAVLYIDNWRHGIGYRTDGVWNIDVVPPGRTDTGQFPDNTGGTFGEVLAAVRALPEVQAVGTVFIAPYTNSEARIGVALNDGRRPQVSFNGASDDVLAVLRLQIVAGRWFEPGDASDAVDSIVINQRLATAVFGDIDPTGQLLPDVPPPPGEQNPRRPWRPRRIVGVISDFRKDGEFGTPRNYMFNRIDLAKQQFGNSILVRTAPDTRAEFEERLQKTVQSAARSWSLHVRRLDDARQSYNAVYLALLIVPGIIAVFVLLMVALGLIGVLWQNVTERTREFGLRRANGASAAAIRRQVLMELLLLASFAVVPGVLLGAQLPVLPIPEYVVPGRVIVAGVVLAAVTIYLVVLACGWYPSRMATAIRPAEALHYE
jgi:putative ABC transport system permease protein